MKTTISIFSNTTLIATATAYGNPTTLIKCLSNIIDNPYTDNMYIEIADDIATLREGCEYRIGGGFGSEWAVDTVDNYFVRGIDFNTKQEAVEYVIQAINRIMEVEREWLACQVGW